MEPSGSSHSSHFGRTEISWDHTIISCRLSVFSSVVLIITPHFTRVLGHFKNPFCSHVLSSGVNLIQHANSRESHSLIYNPSSKWGGTKRSEFISLLFFFAHSPPTAMFLDETVTDLMSFWDYLFKFLPLITSHILSIYSHIFWVLFKLCTAFRMVLVSSMSIHIVQHPTSRDWGNLYHPTQLSDCSFALTVALWFSSYVSMSAAFLKKKEVHMLFFFY